MGTVHDIRPKPEIPKWGRMLDGSYQTEAALATPMLCVGLEVRRDAGQWCWLVADSDGEGDISTIVRSGHEDTMKSARALAEAAAAAVLDDAVKFHAQAA